MDGIREVEDVVETISVSILDVVGDAVAEVKSIATKDDGVPVGTGPSNHPVRVTSPVTRTDRADVVDAEEDALYGRPDPKEGIRLREERLAKMERAKEALKKDVAAARAARLREQAVELHKRPRT